MSIKYLKPRSKWELVKAFLKDRISTRIQLYLSLSLLFGLGAVTLWILRMCKINITIFAPVLCNLSQVLAMILSQHEIRKQQRKLQKEFLRDFL